MRFRKVGKTCQLRVETAEDLEAALSLDESLWVATSAPVSAFRCDPEFLALVDSDGGGRIHTRELKAAVRWLLGMLSDRSRLADGVDVVALSAIRSDTAEGASLVDSARFVLESQGAADAEAVSLEQVRAFTAGVKSRPLNGDGIVPPEAADEPETARFIQDALACTGGRDDSGGRMGIAEEDLARFMDAVGGYLDWRAAGEIPAGESVTEIMPLGAATPDAWNVYERHAAIVDAFFELCRAVRFDPRARSQVGWRAPDPEDLDPQATAAARSYLERMPLAEPTADALLPLDPEAVNPLYRSWLVELKAQVIRPILGETPERLSSSDWERLKAALATYGTYVRGKKGAEVEGLPAERLLEYRDGSQAQKVREMIAADAVVATMLKGVRQVERLLLYHENLMRLVNNFVSFPELYDPERRALFEVGSAVIDGRRFNFAVLVEDLAAHSAIVGASNIFTVYLKVSGAAGQDGYVVAMPATSGSRGNLALGKRGIFFDTQGVEHDARIVRIVENPISLSEAMVAPFVRMLGFVTGKIQKLYGAAQDNLEAQLEHGAAAIQRPAAETPAATAGGRAGMLIGIGVAMAALGSALAYITQTFAELGLAKIALGLLGAVLVVMVPLVVLAAMKLGRQDLSALLEGCGWSINARMRLNRAQRRLFTRSAPYPKGAQGAPPPRWVAVLVRTVLVALALASAYWGARALVARWDLTTQEQTTETNPEGRDGGSGQQQSQPAQPTADGAAN